MVFCGTNGIRCCPDKQSARGSGCNLSGRKKMDPKTLVEDSLYVNGQDPNENTKEPVGTLAGTVGTENHRSPGFLRDGYEYCTMRDDGGAVGYNTNCYTRTALPAPNGLDEFWTRCGYGDLTKLKTQRKDDDIDQYYGKKTWESVGRFGTTWKPFLSDDHIFPDGITGGCSNIGWDAPPGYIYLPTTSSHGDLEAEQCYIYEEFEKDVEHPIQGVMTTGYFSPVIESGFSKGLTIDRGDRGCHYKYRKDWSNPMFNFPPRFTTHNMTHNMNGLSTFATYARTESGIKGESIPEYVSNIRPDQIDPITDGPKARMECCTGSVNSDTGVFASPSPASHCPLTENALDDYTNHEIKTYGAGVYDPLSNVCARYTTDLDGPDTPENWCSYNIVRDDFRWGRSDHKPVVNIVQSGLVQWRARKYPRYMNLLLHGPCNQWLDLDYNPAATDSRMKDTDQLPWKPRSKALGDSLTNFFIWVSGHLADPLLTPAPDESIGLRSDLIQAESKYNVASNTQSMNSRDEKHMWMQGLLLHNETCPSGTSYAPIYVGEYGEDSRVQACQLSGDFRDSPGWSDLVDQCNLDPTSTDVIGTTGSSCHDIYPLINGGCDIVDATTGWKGGLCHVDSISPSPSPSLSPGGGRGIECTNKYYSKNVFGKLKYFPCYQYDGQEDDTWYKEDFSGTRIESDAPTSSSGCGYYPETLSPSTNTGVKNAQIITYLETLSSSPTGQADLQEIIDTNISPGMYESITPSPPDKDDLITIIMASGIFDDSMPGGDNVSECIGDTTSGDRGCCNYLNKDEFFDKDKTTSSIKRLRNYVTDQEKTTLFDTNFDATTSLGQFLNFLTTKQAGAFLHHSAYSRGTEDNAFLINMKKFCARTDIFNWKQPDPSDSPAQTEFKKQYNKLLEARYSKICSCFWSMGDTDIPAEMREEGNPVKEWYKNYMMVDQCGSINSQSPCGDNCILSEDEQTQCLDKHDDDKSMMQTIITFFDSKDPVKKSELEIDNSCWYHTCSSNNYSNDNYSMKKEYGLTTKFTKKPRETDDCKGGSCRTLCLAQNIMEWNTIELTNSSLGQKIDACNRRSSSLPPPDSNKTCGSSGDFITPDHSYDGTSFFELDVTGGGPSPPPSPSPSGDDSSFSWEHIIWIIVAVLLLIGAIIIARRVLARFSSSKDSGGGGEVVE